MGNSTISIGANDNSGDAAMQYPDATHMRARNIRVRGEGIKSVGTNGIVMAVCC